MAYWYNAHTSMSARLAVVKKKLNDGMITDDRRVELLRELAQLRVAVGYKEVIVSGCGYTAISVDVFTKADGYNNSESLQSLYEDVQVRLAKSGWGEHGKRTWTGTRTRKRVR